MKELTNEMKFEVLTEKEEIDREKKRWDNTYINL
jgi:hypothetical protein